MLIRILLILSLIPFHYASELTETTALRLCRDYYNSKAFNGKFTMTPFQARLVDCGGGYHMVHCSYSYKSNFGNESGNDRRIFFIANNKVLGIGQQNSAILNGPAQWTPAEAATFIERGYWNVMAFMDPYSKVHEEWSNSKQYVRNITHRQIYGIILANWATRQKNNLSKEAINKLMLKARNIILQDKIAHPVVANEIYWLYTSVDPKDTAKANEMFDLCLQTGYSLPPANDVLSQQYTAKVISDSYEKLLSKRLQADLALVHKNKDLKAALRILETSIASYPKDTKFYLNRIMSWDSQAQAQEDLGGLSPKVIYNLMLAYSYMHKKDKATFYLQNNKHLQKIRNIISSHKLSNPMHLYIAADLWINVHPNDDTKALQLFKQAVQVPLPVIGSNLERATQHQAIQLFQHMSDKNKLEEHLLTYSIEQSKAIILAPEDPIFPYDITPAVEMFEQRANKSKINPAFPSNLKQPLDNTIRIFRGFALGKNNVNSIKGRLENGDLAGAINYAAQAEQYLLKSGQSLQSPSLLQQKHAEVISKYYYKAKKIHEKLNKEKTTLTKHANKTTQIAKPSSYWTGTYKASNFVVKLNNNNQSIYIGETSAKIYPFVNGKTSSSAQTVKYKKILQQCQANEHGLPEFKLIFELVNGNVLMVTNNRRIQDVLNDGQRSYGATTLSKPSFSVELKSSTYGKSAFKHTFNKQ